MRFIRRCYFVTIILFLPLCGIEKSKKRSVHDYQLFLNDYTRNPDDPRTVFNVAQAYASLGDWENACKYYQIRVNMPGKDGKNFMALYSLAKAYEHLNNWQKALYYYLEAASTHPCRAEPLVRLALHYWDTGKKELCFLFVRRAAQLPYPDSDVLFVEKDVYLFTRYDLLGRAAWYVGAYDIGQKAVQEALKARPDLAYLKRNLNFYVLRTKTFHDILPNNFVFHEVIETAEKIIDIIEREKKGGYLRFGDGDIFLAEGNRDVLQKSTENLAIEMRETFRLNGPNILKSLPLHCSEISKAAKNLCLGLQRSSMEIKGWIISAKKLWGQEMTDVYSPWLLPWLAVYKPQKCIEFLRFLKNKNCCLLVGNKNIPAHVREVLFGQDCTFVATPNTNAYSHIDQIEKACLEKIKDDDQYKIIIISMGCAGRVLQKRLWKKRDNVFFFDFGSLMDALCDIQDFVRWWQKSAQFDGKKFLRLLEQEL